MTHSVVCYNDNEYSGWPANGGIWSWGSEILVSFNRGRFQENNLFHRVIESDMQCVFSRSVDGGLTWAEVDFDNSIYEKELKQVPEEGFEFDENFVMRVGRPAITIKGDVYIVSCDKGKTWDGPFEFPSFGRENTSRTSYLIERNKKMRVFMSHNVLENPINKPFYDRAFVAITEDGCKSWSFVGDITDDAPRSVMPSVVRIDDNTLVAALRRRMKRPPMDDVWIEVKRSNDNGRTWHTPVRAADTYNINNAANTNGNPPAMCKLSDGTLVLAYGRREPGNSSLRVCISTDGGLTFHSDRAIRQDAIDMDMGYPRIVARPDDKCVVVYYIATKERPVQHIEATIFDPMSLNI
ncbi:MAG TPA: exo-alpha-sialidase [Clostridia bacterium]|jgi:hypothetical protein|nr:exo-alpha-sialidase [Clostridia bacterium]